MYSKIYIFYKLLSNSKFSVIFLWNQIFSNIHAYIEINLGYICAIRFHLLRYFLLKLFQSRFDQRINVFPQVYQVPLDSKTEKAVHVLLYIQQKHICHAMNIIGYHLPHNIVCILCSNFWRLKIFVHLYLFKKCRKQNARKNEMIVHVFRPFTYICWHFDL